MTARQFLGYAWDNANGGWLARFGLTRRADREYVEGELAELLAASDADLASINHDRAALQAALDGFPQRGPTLAEKQRGRRLVTYADGDPDADAAAKAEADEAA